MDGAGKEIRRRRHLESNGLGDLRYGAVEREENSMKKIGIISLSLAALLIVLVAGTVWAGQSTHYAIDWQVLSGGGAPASDDTISLNGSLGQTAIGPSTSDSFKLGAGYWLEQAGGTLYLPIIVKNYPEGEHAASPCF